MFLNLNKKFPAKMLISEKNPLKSSFLLKFNFNQLRPSTPNYSTGKKNYFSKVCPTAGGGGGVTDHCTYPVMSLHPKTVTRTPADSRT